MRMAGLDQQRCADPHLCRVRDVAQRDLLLGAHLAVVHPHHWHVGRETSLHRRRGDSDGSGRLGEGGEAAAPDADQEQRTEDLAAQRQVPKVEAEHRCISSSSSPRTAA